MADEEKEKAEKLAAAKKRFEQLKKEQQKKGKKTGTKKKTEKAGGATSQDHEAGVEDDDVAADATIEIDNAPSSKDTDAQNRDDGEVVGEDGTEPSQRHPPSLSQASKQRSESFRQGVTSPTLAGPEVQELYRKQASRIEELEKELKSAKDQQSGDASRLAKAEEELERLREDGSGLAELKNKGNQVQRLESDLASLQRQLAQAQQAAKGNSRRVSGPSADFAQELESKTSNIESMELELSNVRNQLKSLQALVSERDVSIKELEDRAVAAEKAGEAHKLDLETFKVTLAASEASNGSSKESPEALAKRVLILESDLKTAHSSLDATAQRATSLEQKIEALTKLHRDATATSQSKDKELADLRQQVKRRDRPSHVRDASEFELGDEETETGALQTRIRALEAENFDLRRGVWRDKRAELQPDMEDADYEDVDLNAPHASQGRRGSSGILGRQSSSFQDVINSGITAFTGRQRDPPVHASAHLRQQSLGLLDDDDVFDEDAFRLAQEEDAKRRIERVKEIKRGLEDWKGWRLDLADLRQNGIGPGRECGPIFEV